MGEIFIENTPNTYYELRRSGIDIVPNGTHVMCLVIIFYKYVVPIGTYRFSSVYNGFKA